MPPTYERLIAQLRREYPEYSQAEIEAAVAEVASRQHSTHQDSEVPHGQTQDG